MSLRHIVNYPTGAVKTTGLNRALTSSDESDYVTPIMPVNHLRQVDAIIVPTSRAVATVKGQLKQFMELANERGIPIIFLCDKKSSILEIAQLARSYTSLHCTAASMDFNACPIVSSLGTYRTTHVTKTSSSLAAKRNIALYIARKMQLRSVLFVDDDIHMSKLMYDKMLSLLHEGRPIVSLRSGKYRDHSVVVHAFADRNPHLVDTYLSCQASIVSLDNSAGAFFPPIYNEDWLFMLPIILMGGNVTLAGSVRQKRYWPYSRRRANLEEEGDLIAEGLMRLATEIRSDMTGGLRIANPLAELVRRANATFWEREILHRASFVYDSIKHNNGIGLQSYVKKRALSVAYTRLLGDDLSKGIDPNDIEKWVNVWMRDVKIWEEKLRACGDKQDLGTVLDEIGCKRHRITIVPAAVGGVRRKQHHQNSHRVTRDREFTNTTPMLDAPTGNSHGVESTRILSRYLESQGKHMLEVDKASNQLRFDRPIRSLDGNKPLLSIVMLVHYNEDITSLRQSVAQILASNGRGLPLHIILCVTHSSKAKSASEASDYREYVVSSLVHETSGTNVRLLSCIVKTTGGGFEDVVRYVSHRMLLTYWKCEIDSVNHPTFITNSRLESLRYCSLSDLATSTTTELVVSASLHRVIAGLKTPRNVPKLQAQETMLHRRNMIKLPGRQGRIRWLLQVRNTQGKKMRAALYKTGLSWHQLDQLHYATKVHSSDSEQAVRSVYSVACIPVMLGMPKAHIKKMVTRAVTHLLEQRLPTGCLPEVALVVYGDASYDALNRFRDSIVTKLAQDSMLLQGTILLSTICRTSQQTNHYQLAEALVRYEHWIEHRSQMRRIDWVGVGDARIVYVARTAMGARIMEYLQRFLYGLPPSRAAILKLRFNCIDG